MCNRGLYCFNARNALNLLDHKNEQSGVNLKKKTPKVPKARVRWHVTHPTSSIPWKKKKKNTTGLWTPSFYISHCNGCLSASCSLFIDSPRTLSPLCQKKNSHPHPQPPTNHPPSKGGICSPPSKKKKANFPPLLVCVSTHDIYPSRLNAIVTSPQSTVQGLLIHKRGRSLHKMAGLTGSSSISQVLGVFLTHGGKRHR